MAIDQVSASTVSDILFKLDEILSENREWRTKWADHETRIVSLESTREEADRARAMRPHRSPSFTNEVQAIVGDSMRPVADAMERSTKIDIVARLATGAVLALAILAAIIFGGHR